MRTLYFTLFLLGAMIYHCSTFAQTLPGDKIIYGPMLSTVYHDSIRVWVMMKASSGSGDTYTLEVTPESGGAVLTGADYNSDNRSGYYLRSYLYKGLQPNTAYKVTIKKNGTAVTARSTRFTTNATSVTDFEFLAGGCGRIFDMSRCIDQQEAMSHINGTPEIYNHMATESSDLMVWLGDAVYLLGLQHANGQCPTAIDDWANKDACFDRYMFYRKFQDSLIRAMPQLAITDNHDTGPNEFNKDMPTLPITKGLFMEWWPNPVYKSNSQGQGLYSSYKYKDVEFFLLDNRSYRESTVKHLGVDQLAWLKQALLTSTAPFKVLISGTPTFDKRGGGRNFSITAECDDLIKFVKANNINGVLSYSADIHRQEFYGRYNDHTYPFFDVLSGNLASDIGAGNPTITRDNDMLFDAGVQTYIRTNVYGSAGDRRFKIDYVSPEGILYYSTILHEDMLKSIDKQTLKISLSFSNALKDSTDFNRTVTSTAVTYEHDRGNKPLSALRFNASGKLTFPYAQELDMHDRTFSITCWINPKSYPTQGYASIFSNGTSSKGFSIGIDPTGSPVFFNHANNTTYKGNFIIKKESWMHITWKYDNVKMQLYLYSNGQLLQKWSNVATPEVSTATLTLGSNFENKYFDGGIDEFNLFGKLITDAIITNLSEFTSNRGKALALEGSQSTYIPSTELNTLFGNSFTLEFWSRLTATPSTGAKLISCNGRVGGNSTGFALEFGASGKLNLAFGTNGSGWTTISEKGTAWNVAEWNHVALTAVKNDSLYLYINGIKIGSAKYTVYTGNTFGLGLGISSQYASPAQVEMDEFRIWNSPQSKDSIVKRMHYELDGNESNLAFYYNFSPFTNQSVKSKGSNAYELTLVQATLKTSSAPAAYFAPRYHNEVKGNWTIRKTAVSGLTLEDPITAFNTNLLVGHYQDTATTPVLPGNAVYYMKGGWQMDALNLSLATLKINLPLCLPKYDSISKLATEYYLIKESDNNSFDLVSSAYFDGKNLRYTNIFIDSGVYHIAWKADKNARLFGRKGALSLQGNHIVRIPYAKVNPALSGDFTLEFWSRVTGEPNGSLISNHARVAGLSTGLSLEFPGNRTLNAVLGDNGTTGWNKTNCKKDWNIGEWNHIAITASPGGWFKLYYNGKIVDSSAFTAFYPNQIDLALGASINYNNQCTAALDEFRVWKKVRTAKEIQERMHVPIAESDPDLVFNYSFNHADRGYILNTGTLQDSVSMTNAQLIPSTAPLGELSFSQQYHVTGSWSVRDTTNSGLSVLVSISDYETNLVMGRNELTGSEASSESSDVSRLRTLWQIDALKISQGTFVFDGPIILSEQWNDVKGSALEYYLMKKNTTNELVIEAVGTSDQDEITFTSVNLDYGIYTLGWKNSITGLIDKADATLRFYPNPSHEFITLSGSTEDINEVFVHDINGQSVVVSYSKQGKDVIIDTRVLTPGMYVIVMSTKNSQDKQALRFIKQ